MLHKTYAQLMVLSAYVDLVPGILSNTVTEETVISEVQKRSDSFTVKIHRILCKFVDLMILTGVKNIKKGMCQCAHDSNS
ncbi:hypothetical protein DPMN_066873 [Dreissena polymorpha]|uniref:Uncharacterized protein n=1 Tax=Dreissena polymorpha TaxID=45954 RepID=A0A9D3YWB5_DREPO|nr:hypothetical protein DPMN_066873 [Dreissena polymorpha]